MINSLAMAPTTSPWILRFSRFLFFADCSVIEFSG